MSMAEKLTIIAENEQKVYDAGKTAEYDRFWDDFQQNGNRTDYSYCFTGAGWTAQIFKPKYTITPQYCNGLFNGARMQIDLSSHLESLGITLDTSQAEQINSMYYDTRFTRVGVVDLTSSGGTISTLFAYSRYLKIIDRLVVREDQSLQNPFMNCGDLENVTIEGTIGKSGISLAWSTKLSKASIESIVEALSTTASGQTIILAKKAVEAAFTTDEWNALAATKANWTITLT